MLHVAVHRDDDIAVRMVEAAGQRELVAVVAREQHRLDARILALEPCEDGAALVARAIVDKDDLPVEVKTGHRLADGFVKVLQIILFVVDGYDDGQSLFLHEQGFPSLSFRHHFDASPSAPSAVSLMRRCGMMALTMVVSCIS